MIQLTGFVEISIELSPAHESWRELILALLSEFGFDGFVEEEARILAYAPAGDFSQEDFESYLSKSGIRDKIKSLLTVPLPDRNWNAAWEQEYAPVHISDQCMVRAPFHQPPEDLRYDLVISPKMSFGTAHHETTRLMMLSMMEYTWMGQKVLDFGCGTGVLSIFAEKLGAPVIIALDHDTWAYRNSLENIELNACKNIRVVQGEIGSLNEGSFTTILGNINLNVLLEELKNLSSHLADHGMAILSGFYESDLEILNISALEYGLKLVRKRSMNEWTVADYRKAD